MTRRRVILLIAALVLGLALLLWPRVRLFFQVDACLDAGGRWNHERAACEHS
jgi:hypothetical protein